MSKEIKASFDEAKIDHYLMKAFREKSPDPLIQLLVEMRDEFREVKKGLEKDFGAATSFFWYYEEQLRPRVYTDLDTKDNFVGINLQHCYKDPATVYHMYGLVSEKIKRGEMSEEVEDAYKLKNGFEGIFSLNDKDKIIHIKL